MDILYHDDALLVVNKPAGLATLPDGYDPTLPHVKSLLEQEYGRLWIVHRLDKDTSGVLLLARTAHAHHFLNTQFDQRQVSKVYHALVAGSPGWDETTVDLPLRPNGDRRHRTVVDPQAGKPAITHLKVLERFAGACLLEAIPTTGRTHQIRAHLVSLGLSILEDRLYAGRQSRVENDENPLPGMLRGMGLHARSLEVTHPTTGERMVFEAPYPLEWDQLLQKLRVN
jgi:tRNA pseudouridine32 synthase/23S rRNA pseudouridine746 synthase